MTSYGQRYLAALMTCFLLLALFLPPASADTLVMPRDLVNFAIANGCTPIDNFFERPGMINPPYVLLDALASGAMAKNAVDRENVLYSAAFWCKKKATSEKPYSLMFRISDPKELGGCPTIIEWPYPMGLSIETRSSLALRNFRYVTDQRRTGPTTTVVNARVIVNDNNDGLIDTFYCHQGQWLVESLE